METRSFAGPAPLGTFAALAYRNYRLWFVGQMVSLFGTWMQSTAQGYLVFELTHSEAFLGYVGFSSGVTTWAFTLYGGAIADRFPRRNLIVVTQSLSMVLAFVLSVLVFLRVVAPWHIIVLAFLLGVVNSFDAPARQSFVLEMVDRRLLTNAIALVQTLTPDAVRGRVMSIYMLGFLGFMPIGALLAGSVATAVGVPLTVEIGAAATLACALAVMILVPSVRRLD